MATQIEEQQAQDFLKRAEIKTMRKDLLKLREADSIIERNKIATIKTLEEQREEHQKKLAALELASASLEKNQRENILQKNETQEYEAEKDLKVYATEEERQKIFLFESQRFAFIKQVDIIDKEKDPALKLQKNEVLLQVSEWHKKLAEVIEQEKKVEDEQKLIIEKERTSAIPEERRSLEQRRSELDIIIQDIEKKRWAVETQIQDLEAKIKIIDQSSNILVTEKNSLNEKILGIDKSLREIYSGVMERVEEKRRGESEAQKAQRAVLEKARAEKNSQVQREQHTGRGQDGKNIFQNTPKSLQEKLEKTKQSEEDQRKKFLENIKMQANKNVGQQQQKSNIK